MAEAQERSGVDENTHDTFPSSAETLRILRLLFLWQGNMVLLSFDTKK